MKKLLIVLACLVCFSLNTSMFRVSFIEKSDFSTIQLKEAPEVEFQGNSSSALAKGFKPPRGRVLKGGAPKQPPKGNAPKGGHDKNVREGNREKHEKADGRRQREQAKAEEKRKNNKKKK